MTTAADLEARAGQLDAVAAVVRRKTEVELELRAQLVALWEATPVTERRYVADELAVVLAESSRSTQHWVDTALAASCYPEVQALVDDGTWTTRHADAVTGELGMLTREQRALVLELVLSQKAARTPHELKKATRAAVYVVDPEAAEKAAEKAKRDRSVTSEAFGDGRATLFMDGPKAAIALAMASLDALAVKAGPEDDRTLLQRRFDTLMLLVTGQLTPAGAHIQVLVSLATLEGGNAPAEIPGQGLITAQEARELVDQAASVRRVVVDEEGQLVSVDSDVEKAPVEEQEQVVLLTDELEPEAVVDEDPDHVVSDEEWLLAQQPSPETARRQAAQDLYDLSHPCPGAPDAPEQQAAQAQLRALLAVLKEQEAMTGRRVGDAHVRIQPDGSMVVHYPDDPEDPPPGGGTDPPATPTWPLPAGYVDDRHARRVHDAGLPLPADAGERARELQLRWLRRHYPSWKQEDAKARWLASGPLPVWRSPLLGDEQWHLEHPDRALAHSLIDLQITRTPLAAAPEGGWPTLPQPRKAWEPRDLGKVLEKLIGKPVAPLPAASSAYPFRGPLARHLKTRDQTCRFPGCPRLAVHCDCDHRIPWPFGPTSIVNGISECEHHHQCKHAIMQVDRLDDGTIRWQLRTGHYADSPSRALIRGW